VSRKIVIAVTTVALLVAALALPSSAAAQGASECQPAAGQRNAALAHQLGGLGSVAGVVAPTQPGLISTLTKAELFTCP
jgi:hypothetical protein